MSNEVFGLIDFSAPLALVGLLALPIIWILLRTLPPPPRRQAFPPTSLMHDIGQSEVEADQCPLWLRILRIMAVTAVILGCAGPIIGRQDAGFEADKPVIILIEGSWAEALDWNDRIHAAEQMLEITERSGHAAFVAVMTDLMDDSGHVMTPADWERSVSGVEPNAWLPDGRAVFERLSATLPDSFDTYWIASGIRISDFELLEEFLSERGRVTIIDSGKPVYVLRRAQIQDGSITVELMRVNDNAKTELIVEANGNAPFSNQQVEILSAKAEFAPDETTATAVFNAPLEIVNRIQSFKLRNVSTAGAVSLVGSSLSQRRVGLFSGRSAQESGHLLSEIHYLTNALQDSAEIVEGELSFILKSDPDVIILADVGRLPEVENEALANWVQSGGVLLRYAGPRTAAASVDVNGDARLFPVRIRSGGRRLGGSLSWGSPQNLKPFARNSPFYGLEIPNDLQVTAQILAEPGLDLVDKVWAELADGTPFVTAKPLGAGMVVMFHIPANAEWSNLVLSELFLAMLERLAVISSAGQEGLPDNAEELQWQAVNQLNAFGILTDVVKPVSVSGTRLAGGAAGPDLPPGTYVAGQFSAAVNAVSEAAEFIAASYPNSVTVVREFGKTGKPIRGHLLALAVLLLAADALASVMLSGRLIQATAVIAALAVSFVDPDFSMADEIETQAIERTDGTPLAYIRTGESKADAIVESGLNGLAAELTRRTSIVPGGIFGVDPKFDELSFFPVIYWPISERTQLPDSNAIDRLNGYLRNGGMILIDTSDSGIGGVIRGSGGTDRLRALARILDIPELYPLPNDHVLTRSFYFLDEFPGRYDGAIWVENTSAKAETFDNLSTASNDGVTPVIVGGNDWAAAWANSADGTRQFSTGLGRDGVNRRESAIRFGVNLIMHALTGNYKSDQLQLEELQRRAKLH